MCEKVHIERKNGGSIFEAPFRSEEENNGLRLKVRVGWSLPGPNPIKIQYDPIHI